MIEHKLPAFARVAALCAVAALVTAPASAQSWKKEWDRLVAAAKGKTLHMNYQGNKGYDGAIRAFEQKFGVKVEVTASRTSQALSRIRTEQRNGRFDWDIWWGPTSNMSNVAAPAGILTPMEPFFVLPEVKDTSNWLDPDYIWGDTKKQVFLHANEITYGAFVNRTALAKTGVGMAEVESLDALVDPRLKGKIAMREASRPNAGAFAVTSILHVKGAAFLRKFLTEANPRIYRSPQQVNATAMRGGHAIALGVQNNSLAMCYKDGGCKDVVAVKSTANVLPRGLAIFKNPPHPDLAKLFINWILSKEGQEIVVKSWAKFNVSGAHSMRKDVKPIQGQEASLPDFSNAKQYIFVGSHHDYKEVREAVNIFRSVRGIGKKSK